MVTKVLAQRESEDPPPTKKIKPQITQREQKQRDQQQLALTNVRAHPKKAGRTLPNPKSVHGLGCHSRPSVCETTLLPRGRFCPNKLWASRRTRQTEPPPPSSRDQWSLGKKAPRERKGAKQVHAGVKMKSKEQPPPERMLGRGAPCRDCINGSHSLCNTG